MPANKKQHFVPRCLLKNFSTNDKVFVFNVPKDVILDEPVPYKSQCQEDHLYGKDGEWESWLKKYEDKVAPIFASLIGDEALSEEQQIDLKRYMLIQSMRTKRAISNRKRMMTEAYEWAIPLMAHFQGAIISNDKIRFFAEQFVDEHTEEEYAKEDLHTAETYLESFADLSIRILEAKELSFVCSDHPALLFNPFQPEYGIGLEVAGLMVVMPVSPRHCILLYDEGIYEYDDSIKVAIGSETVLNLNHLQYSFCNELVFSNQKSTLNELKNFFWRTTDSIIANKLKEKGIQDAILLNREVVKVKKFYGAVGKPINPKCFLMERFKGIPDMKIRASFIPFQNNPQVLICRNPDDKYEIRGSFGGDEFCKVVDNYYSIKERMKQS